MSDPVSALPPTFPALSLADAHARITAPGMPCEVIDTVIGGRACKTWKNAPPSLGAVLAWSRTHGQKIAFVHADERVTFEAHYRAASAFARHLFEAGVQKGDRVAIVMRNLPEWPVVFYGAAAIGAIVTPLNAWWTGPELAYAVQDSGASVLILDGERHARFGAELRVCPAVRRIHVSRPIAPLTDGREIDLADVIGAPDAWSDLLDLGPPPVAVDPDDDATLFYTSGTTGRPKGVLSTHRATNANIITALSANHRAFVRRGETPPVPGPDTPQPSGLISVPFFHVTGCVAILNPSLFGGVKLAMMRKWDAVEAFGLIEREKLAAAGGVPTVAWQLIEHPERDRFDLSSLVSLAWGGAPSAPELVRRIKEVFPASHPGQGWGMTETSGTFSGHSAEDFEHRPDSCGPASPVGVLEIRDATDGVTRLPTGQVGELWAYGPMVAKGYWNQPEATAATFVDGWVRTGDLARLDDEGFCYIVDRAKDMLIRGGENIFCIEAENVLYDHPDVMDAAVFGLPHPTLGEEPAAAVALKSGSMLDEAALIAFARATTAAYKVPVRIAIQHEPLPRNPNGKILKAELKRRMLEAG